MKEANHSASTTSHWKSFEAAVRRSTTSISRAKPDRILSQLECHKKSFELWKNAKEHLTISATRRRQPTEFFVVLSVNDQTRECVCKSALLTLYPGERKTQRSIQACFD